MGTDEEGDVTNNLANNMIELTFIMTQMRELRYQNNELKIDLQAFRVVTSSLLQHMNASVLY